MKRIFGKTSIFISLIILIILIVVLFLLYNKIESNKLNYQDKETSWQIESQKRIQIKMLNNSISQIKNERGLLETHFAQSTDVVPFLNNLEETGSKIGARAEVAGVDISKDGKTLNVELKISGKFESIYKLIMLIENSSYIMDIASVDMSKENVKDKNANWKSSIKIKLLSFTS